MSGSDIPQTVLEALQLLMSLYGSRKSLEALWPDEEAVAARRPWIMTGSINMLQAKAILDILDSI